jgi:hypothetical protein
MPIAGVCVRPSFASLQSPSCSEPAPGATDSGFRPKSKACSLMGRGGPGSATGQAAPSRMRLPPSPAPTSSREKFAQWRPMRGGSFAPRVTTSAWFVSRRTHRPNGSPEERTLTITPPSDLFRRAIPSTGNSIGCLCRQESGCLHPRDRARIAPFRKRSDCLPGPPPPKPARKPSRFDPAICHSPRGLT